MRRSLREEHERKELEASKTPANYYNVELHARANPLVIPALMQTGNTTAQAELTEEEHLHTLGEDLDALMWRAHRMKTQAGAYVEAKAREDTMERVQKAWEMRQLQSVRGRPSRTVSTPIWRR